MKNDHMIVERKINIIAERLVSGKELIRVMSLLPNAKLISVGSCYSFDIDFGIKSAKLSMECYRDNIVLEFKSVSVENFSLYDLSIIIFSILAYLKDSYSAKLESLYPIIINSLRAMQKDNQMEPKNEPNIVLFDEVKRNNIALSEIAIQKIRENAIKLMDLSKFSDLLESISRIYWNDDNAISKFCEASGVGIETVKWALDYKKGLINEPV
ncbi:MAG: hypothetical protein QW814_02650 [Methanothrix sp.]